MSKFKELDIIIGFKDEHWSSDGYVNQEYLNEFKLLWRKGN